MLFSLSTNALFCALVIAFLADCKLLKIFLSVNILQNFGTSTLSQIASWNQGLAQLLSGQGLPALLENLDIVGKQEIISMAEQQLEQQQNQPQQPDPAMMKVQAQMEANQNTATKNANDFNIAQQEVNLRGQEIGIKAIATHGKVSNETARTQIKATAEANNAASDMEGTNLERDKMNFPTPDAKLDFMESMHGN